MEIICPIYFEEWKNIINHEGYYMISSFGNVMNSQTGIILTGDINNIGYRRITLYRPFKKRYFIHRLVAYHFVPGFRDDLVVNHIDGNKFNNFYKNLEWVTRSENDLHAYRMNLRKPHPCQFKKQVEIYNLETNQSIKIFNNSQECSDFLNASRSNIYACCNGYQLSCKGYGIRYV